MDNKIYSQKEIEDFVNSPKVNVTTNIPTEIKKYADERRININRLIEVGFRTMTVTRGENARIAELEESVEKLQKAIDFYDKRIKDMWTKFSELKTKYKIVEEI